MDEEDYRKEFRAWSVAKMQLIQRLHFCLAAGDFAAIERMGNGSGLTAAEIRTAVTRTRLTPLEKPKKDGLIFTRKSSIRIEGGREVHRTRERVWVVETEWPDLVVDLSVVREDEQIFVLNIHGFTVEPFDSDRASFLQTTT